MATNGSLDRFACGRRHDAGVVNSGRPWRDEPSNPAEVPETPLHRAARVGDHDAIRRLIAHGGDVDELLDVQTSVGGPPILLTPLGQSAMSHQGASVETIRILLDLGASLSHQNTRIMLMVAAKRNPELADVLLGTGAFPDGLDDLPSSRSPLEKAVRSGSVETVRALLDAGADPNRRKDDRRRLLGEARSLEMLDLLLDAGVQVSPPVVGKDRPGWKDAPHVLASIAGDGKVDRTERVAMLRRLIEARQIDKADVDESLDFTSTNGLSALLEIGADPHADRYLLGGRCSGGMEQDHAATERFIDVLIDAGLDPNDQDEHGFRPLLQAVSPEAGGSGYQWSEGYSRPAALALIRRGADVNIVYPSTDIEPLEGGDLTGFTPLHLAARAGDGVVVEAMLDAGADPLALIPDGRSALDLLEEAVARLEDDVAAARKWFANRPLRESSRSQEDLAWWLRRLHDARTAAQRLNNIGDRPPVT